MRLKSSPESGKELRNRMVRFALILGKDPIVIVIVINLISKINVLNMIIIIYSLLTIFL